MKKRYIVVCALLTILVCSTVPNVVAFDVYDIDLPKTYVTLVAVYGIDAWFDMTISNVSSGFDITNGVYPGWCVQKNIEMTKNVSHRVILYSSYDSPLPVGFGNESWNKINYIINHKQGSRTSIQKAIWYYTDNENCSSDPNAQAMVDAAEQNGSEFVPQSGQIIAIPIEGRVTIQRAFLELAVPFDSPSEPSQPGTPQNVPPTADGTAGEPYQGIVNEVITFDGSRSYDQDGLIVFWQWTFGDGVNGSEPVVNHSYSNPGTYNVTLMVVDNKGARDTYLTKAYISYGNNPPSKPVISGPLTGRVSDVYNYSVVATDPDGDALVYIIDWGDGSHNTSTISGSGDIFSMAHSWSNPGFYTVQVYAQDPSNATSDLSTIKIAIDVRYVRNLGYLMNIDSVGPYDAFYSNTTQNFTTLKLESSWVYSIDSDGDGSFDYQYNVPVSYTHLTLPTKRIV